MKQKLKNKELSDEQTKLKEEIRYRKFLQFNL